jgi:cytoskeletal protein CcmA (bactofilin family)
MSGSVIIAAKPDAQFPSLDEGVKFLVDEVSLFKQNIVSSGSLSVKQSDGSPVFQVAASSGNTTVGGTLGVVGAANLSSNATIGGTLGVVGASTFSDAATFSQGLSGSLTKLANGSSAFVAGAGVSIVSASNGAITISAGGGGIGGSDTQIQFNDGGSFAGDSGLTYNKTSDTLNGVSGSFYRLAASDALSSAGTLTVSGEASFSSGVTVAQGLAASYADIGGGYASSGVSVSAAGDVKASGALTVDGNAYLSGSVQAASLDVVGSAVVGAALDVVGLSSLDGGIDVNSSAFTVSTAGAIAGSSIGVTGDASVGGSLVVSGDMTVMGAVTSIDTTNLIVKDSLIGLGYASGSSEQANGDRGLILAKSGDNVAMYWDDSDSKFYFTYTDSSPSASSVNSTGLADLGLRSGSLQALSVSGQGTVGGLLTANSGIQVSGGAIINGGATVASGITVTSGGASINGAATFSSTLGVTGNVSLTSALSVGGATTLNGATVSGAVLDVNAGLTANEIKLDGDVAQRLYFVGSDGSIQDNAALNWDIAASRLDVTGSLIVSSNASVDGALSANGNVTLGDANTDTIVFNGRAASDLLPSADALYNLGSPDKRWAHMYTGDLHLRNERGDYTLIEEPDFLSIRFNKSGKRYKFMLEAVPELDEELGNFSKGPQPG